MMTVEQALLELGKLINRFDDAKGAPEFFRASFESHLLLDHMGCNPELVQVYYGHWIMYDLNLAIGDARKRLSVGV